MWWEALAPVIDPVLSFTDDLFVTNEEGQQLDISATNADAALVQAGANQTVANAELISAQDAAVFTEDEQRQLAIIIISVIVIIFIVAIFVIIFKTPKAAK